MFCNYYSVWVSNQTKTLEKSADKKMFSQKSKFHINYFQFRQIFKIISPQFALNFAKKLSLTLLWGKVRMENLGNSLTYLIE